MKCLFEKWKRSYFQLPDRVDLANDTCCREAFKAGMVAAADMAEKQPCYTGIQIDRRSAIVGEIRRAADGVSN